MANLTRVCGLYRKRSREGNEYFSGRLADGRKVYVFENRLGRKPKDRQPGWWLMVEGENGQQ